MRADVTHGGRRRTVHHTFHHKGDGGHYKSGARKCPNPCRLGYPYPYRAFSALLIDEDHANHLCMSSQFEGDQ